MPGSSPGPGDPKKIKKKSAKKQTFSKDPDVRVLNRFFCRLWVILRYRNINPIFDTEFSPGVRISHQKQAPIGSQASFQNIDSHCSKTALDEKKCSFTAVRDNILKTCLGTYRSPFLIGNSSSRRKFSIKDRVKVAISQNHSKSGTKFRFKTWKSGSLKNVGILVDFCFFFSIFFGIPGSGGASR